VARHRKIADANGGVSVPFTPEEETAKDAEEAVWASEESARAAEEVQRNRRNAYREEADSIFFEEQAGEVDSGTWAEKRSEIKLRFPK